jgi:hypothetical protein
LRVSKFPPKATLLAHAVVHVEKTGDGDNDYHDHNHHDCQEIFRS